MSDNSAVLLEKIDDYRWRIPVSYKYGMRVPGIVYADEKLLKDITRDRALEQVANVAFLPGIVRASYAMPDIHWGYGFCIGGVAATDPDNGGVVSPGGIGFDINCGVRLIRTDLRYEEIKDNIKDLVYALFNNVPSGVGSKGSVRVSTREEKEILVKGAQWAVARGYGTEEDIERTEERGAIQGANPDTVSERAYDRGKAQSGTLGSGNHFLEIQVVDQLYGRDACDALGLDIGQVMIMIHTGSRGFGYQICDDYTRQMGAALQKYGISVPDRQLACAPLVSPEGKAYIGAMRCAANYAWANRQCITHLVRQAFEHVLKKSWQKMGMSLVYDVAHNIGKFERHDVDGKEKLLFIHRKGATRAFGPGHPALPNEYRDIGQPVIIPGDMGRNSYLLAGTSQAMEETFGSTCHGAGRVLSRSQAMKSIKYDTLMKDLEGRGVFVRASGRGTVVEEAPQAYKDVNAVVDVVHNAGISKRVCRMRPVGVVKG